MAFTAGSTITNGREQIVSQTISQSSTHQLNTKEIEILLSLIRRSNFLGEDIEPLYNLVIKLQNQHLEQNK
jgi:hypothetical protein